MATNHTLLRAFQFFLVFAAILWPMESSSSPVISQTSHLFPELVQNYNELSIRDRRNSQYIHPIEKCIPENKTMVIRGVKVKVSDYFNKMDHLICHDANKIEIFATESITIDVDLNGDNATIVMMAPELIVIDRRRIQLRGMRGNAPYPLHADTGTPNNPSGKSGEPGLHGGHGGNFIGLFEHVTSVGHESSLLIDVSGGRGGNGQNGGRGLEGESGIDLTFEDFPSPYSVDGIDCRKSAHFLTPITPESAQVIKNCVLPGLPGNDGGNGGDGGAGGLGGFPGFVNVTVVSGKKSMINVRNDKGKNGKDGLGGLGGKVGKNGSGYQCTLTEVMGYWRWWSGCQSVPNRSRDAKAGKSGKTGGNTGEILESPDASIKEDELVELQKNFVKFLELNIQ